MHQDTIISKHSGIAYPEQALHNMAQVDNGKLEDALGVVVAQQALFAADMLPANDFNQGLKDRLDTVAAELKILEVMKTMFPSWHEVVYVLKMVCARLFGISWLEQFDVWKGPGQNGKGLLLRVLRELFGSYYTELNVCILCERHRSADSPSPAWMELRGVRLACVAECESSMKIVSSTVKTLRDQTTVITSRDLKQNNVKWQPQFGMVLCTNVNLKFTSNDGGVERSASTVVFQYKFTAQPTEPHHRRCDPGLKQADMIKRMTEELFFVLKAVKKIMFPVSFVPGDSVIRPRPYSVVEATMAQLAGPLEVNDAQAYLRDKCDIVDDGGLASTSPSIVRAYLAHCELPYTRTAAHQASREITQWAFACAGPGGKQCLRPLGAQSGFYKIRGGA